MQRRAAAVYVAFFLVVGAVSFSLIATASTPQFSVEDPEYALQANETFTVNGTEYTVASVSAETSEEGEVTRSGTIRWTNESARFTEEWTNASTVTYGNASWNVSIASGNNTTEVSLVEQINRTAILRNDSSVENRTTTVNGTEYVVRQEGNGLTLVPASEYFPEPRVEGLRQGQQFEYNGNETTVATVSNSSVTLAWTAPLTNEVSVSDQANVTVGSSTFFASFPDNSTLALTTDYGQYAEFQEETTLYTNNVNGLWGVTILSGLAALFVGALAYLPSRY